MVREAQGDKAPIQRFADAVSAWFVPVVIILALATFLIWFFPLHADFLTAFSFAIAVMVIACPCAMGLATPTAIMVGSGIALGRGILVKKGSALETISRLQVLLLDKTGTLTTGTPVMTDLVPVSRSVDPEKLLECLATAEAHSSHPLAQAAVTAAAEAGIQPGEAQDFEERGGYGITCSYGGFRLAVGNERLMEEEGVNLSSAGRQSRGAGCRRQVADLRGRRHNPGGRGRLWRHPQTQLRPGRGNELQTHGYPYLHDHRRPRRCGRDRGAAGRGGQLRGRGAARTANRRSSRNTSSAA